MSLREEIKSLSGNKRRFFLLRIADMDTKAALKLCGVVRGTYNSWCQNREFVDIYRRREEFTTEYKQEAIKLLRRDNQLEAVLLEGKILSEMKKELEVGEYSLIKSHLAREVYSKLMSDLDTVPQVPALTFQQRLQQIFNLPPGQLPERGVIDGEFRETDSQQEKQLEESTPLSQGEQTPDTDEEET